MHTLSRFLCLSLLISLPCFAQQYIVKFATLAPDGTSWMNVMKEYDAAVRKESGGRIGFRIYPSAQQGDEKVVLRKIRIGQLHSGGFTGVGIGEISPRVRILDSPFLFRTYPEIDFVYEKFGSEFEKALEEGGYVLLGWTEVGFVNVFTNTRISKPDDLKSLKMWTWEGDPIAETAFRVLGINPIPLSIDNVLTSLQTGLIDAFYTSPYAALSLQWFTRVKYMVDVPLANASGAVLISKKYFDTIPTDLQDILRKNGKLYLSKLSAMNRADNKKSVEEFKKRGLTIIEVNEADVEHYVKAGAQARRQLVGKLFSAEFLNSVEQALDDFRKNPKGPK